MGKLTFGERVEHPSLPGIILGDNEFLAPIIGVTNGEDYRITFLTRDYFAENLVNDQSLIKKGSSVACYTPSNNTTERRESFSGIVEAVSPSLCASWLHDMISTKIAPRALDQIHISFDFSVSIMTALELSAGTCWFPGDRPVPTDDGLMYEGFAVSDIVCKPEVKDVLVAAYNEIQAIHGKVLEYTSAEIAKCLLPVGLMVRVPVTRSINEWRQFLLSQPTCLESAYLRVQLYKHLANAADPLFTGCESVETVYAKCKQMLGE